MHIQQRILPRQDSLSMAGIPVKGLLSSDKILPSIYMSFSTKRTFEVSQYFL